MKFLEMIRTEETRQEISQLYVDRCEAVTLRDGTALTIRTVRPDDTPRLQAFYGRLSRECISARFLGTCKELPHKVVERLTNVDLQTQMALVATREQHGEEVIIAVARYWVIPVNEPGLAEPAVVVEDRYQNRGLGTHLLKRLAAYARAHGVRTFLFTVHHSNTRILRLIRRSGLPIESKMESGIWEIQVKLETEPVLRDMVNSIWMGSVGD
jgi:GNAT superfamily N-acetyltransferase